jgi:hypothetical protein
MTKEEHFHTFTNIHDQLSEYAKKNKDMFLMILFGISIIKSSLKTFIDFKQWGQVIKVIYLITDLFNEVNEIDFPDK